MKLTEKETLKKIEFLLERMWSHSHDGSTLFPVPSKFWTSDESIDWNKITEYRKRLKEIGVEQISESLLFEIMYQEIFPLIKEALKE